MATWSTIVNTLSAAVEGITPSVSASITFAEIETAEDIDTLPASQPYRRFFIEVGDATMSDDLWTHTSVRINSDFTIIVSYKANRGPQ